MLPSGRLGPEAFAWIDWLAAAGQTWWQMLPLTPPDKHGSPYKSASGLLGLADPAGEPDRTRLHRRAHRVSREGLDWIEDWIAFAGPEALDDQVRFDREWAELRRYAADRGVKLIGDVPIARLGRRARPSRALRPGFVLSVPPDAFADGQLWSNPVDWPPSSAAATPGGSPACGIFELFDLVRIKTTSARSRLLGRPGGLRRSPRPGRGSAAQGSTRRRGWASSP